MSDGIASIDGTGPGSATTTQSLTAGQMLRNARESVGLHVGALAVSMKVPVKKLEALEADRFDLLPDAVFVRALASSVCRTLKIDAAPVLDKLPRSHAPQLGPGDRAVNEPFYAYGKSGGLSISSLLSKPSALWVLGFLVATVAVFFLPELQRISQRHVESASTEAVIVSATPVTSESASETSEPISVPNLATNVESALPEQPVVSASGAGFSDAASPIAQAPTVGSSGAPLGAATVAGVAPQVVLPAVDSGSSDLAAEALVLKARGPTWVKVVDAKGAVQLMKILVAGEAARVGGAMPLSVVVGAADSLDVLVHGVAFDVQTVAKDNVARFEVK